MKKVSIAAVIFISVAGGVANSQNVAKQVEVQEVVETGPRIEKGNNIIGEGAGLGYSSINGFLLYLEPSYQHFVARHLAVGAIASYSSSNNWTTLWAGPEMTYYLAVIGSFAPYIKQIIFSDMYEPARITSNTSVGVSWFARPSFAISLGISYVQGLFKESDAGSHGSFSSGLGYFF